MLKLTAQFNKHSGPTALGQHRLTFDVPKEFASSLYYALEKLEGQPHVMMYLDILEDKESLMANIQETEKQRWNRLNKKIHANFDEIAKLKKIESKDVKKAIKEKLIKKKVIKSSLKELTDTQQLEVLTDLENLIIKLKYE